MQKKLSTFKISLILLLLASRNYACIVEFGAGGNEMYPSSRPKTRLSAQKIHEIVEARIASGKDLNLPMDEIPQGNDNRYLSPLIVCCENPPYLETIELLLNKKANPNIIGGDNSPISLICSSFSSHAHLLALRLLIDAKSYVDGYPFQTVSCLCEKPQNEALLKDPELRLEAMELLLNAKAKINYETALIALLKSFKTELPSTEYRTLLQERKRLINRLLRTNVSIFNKENPNFLDLESSKYNSLNSQLVEYSYNHEKERCKLNVARYQLSSQLMSAQRKNPLSSFYGIPRDIILKIILLVHPKISER